MINNTHHVLESLGDRFAALALCPGYRECPMKGDYKYSPKGL